MKEYGIDLELKLDQIEKERTALINKIRKRKVFLINNASLEIMRRAVNNNDGLNLISTNDTPIKVILQHIKAIEKAYTDQSEQLDIFKE